MQNLEAQHRLTVQVTLVKSPAICFFYYFLQLNLNLTGANLGYKGKSCVKLSEPLIPSSFSKEYFFNVLETRFTLKSSQSKEEALMCI